MDVSFSEQFKRAYRKRVGKNDFIEIEFRQTLELFISNPFDAKLKTHKFFKKRCQKKYFFQKKKALKQCKLIIFFVKHPPMLHKSL